MQHDGMVFVLTKKNMEAFLNIPEKEFNAKLGIIGVYFDHQGYLQKILPMSLYGKQAFKKLFNKEL